MKKLRKSKDPVAVTVRKRAVVVVHSSEANQRLLDIAAQAEAEEGIRQGLDDAKKGKTRSAKEFFDEFEANHSKVP